MAIVFVHGVNTRDSDSDYQQAVGARRVLFDRLVASVLPKDRFASFATVDDVYWGDLGVQFGWTLQSIPKTRTLESLGAEEASVPGNPDLLYTITQAAKPQVVGSRVQSLGAEGGLLANAADHDPGQVVRAILAPEAARFNPLATSLSPVKMSNEDKAAAQIEGEQLALLILAANQLAKDAALQPDLISGEDDAEVLRKIKTETKQRYNDLADQQQLASVSRVQDLGGPFDWARKQVDSLVKSAGNVIRDASDFVTGAGEEATRAASLMILQAKRDEISQKALRFLGDVFVYLRRGHLPNTDIAARVRDGIRKVAERKNPDGTREPLIVVTHSFGSIILYDFLTSGEDDSLKIDLWVTVAAQTSLFAEMRLYGSSSKSDPSKDRPTLGKPKQVTRWVNFYDAADVLSYLHQPVFGDDQVTDIQVRDRANLTNAHGHYFLTTEFYERIGRELKDLLDRNALQ